MRTLRPTTKRIGRSAAGAALAAHVIAQAPGEVWAQQATALDRFDPAPVTGPFFAVPEPAVEGRLRPYAGAVVSIAAAPLVLDGASGSHDVVDHQVILHADAGIELGERVLVDVSFPGVLSQGGDATALDATPRVSVAPGDLRVGTPPPRHLR